MKISTAPITAAEAKKIALAATCPRQIAEVYSKIREFAEKGFCSVSLEERLLPPVVQRLRADGYSVIERQIYADIYDLRHSCEISWL